MLRRCVSELSSARSLGRRRRLISAQTPFFLSSRNGFSTAPPKKTPQKPVPPEVPSDSGSPLKKIVLGSVIVGGAALAAYQTGYIDRIKASKSEQHESNDLEAVTTLKHTEVSNDRISFPSVEKSSDLKPNNDDIKKIEPHHLQNLEVNHETESEIKPAEGDAEVVIEKELSKSDETTVTRPVPNEQTSSQANFDVDNNARFDLKQNKSHESSIVENNVSDSSIQVPDESAIREEDAPYQDTTMEVPKVSLDEGKEVPTLADSYLLHADEASSSERKKTDDVAAFFNEKEKVTVPESRKSIDENKPGDEKIVLDFIEAIHAAETRQAEKDAYIFAEEKRKLKEKYEKELKDARVRELMYAEEAAILEKELNKEKTKAAAAIKSHQEKAEQKLHMELQHKEEEAEIQLTKAQELAKAELAAAIASEKASQIEKIAEANMNINALCMAFYARSEEARQTHSVHKLALGTLALEDALSKGLPIRAEVNTLHKSLEGIDKDSLLDLVLSSLPEEVLNYGADTQIQLNQKFDSLKGTLRHFSLIPAGGGGLLAHTVAHVASSIKMRGDQSGDGIESVISKVENYLVQGKLAEAAEALEGGVQGSEAAQVVVEWVRQARNRAVVEQALSLLQSYASSITFS